MKHRKGADEAVKVMFIFAVLMLIFALILLGSTLMNRSSDISGCKQECSRHDEEYFDFRPTSVFDSDLVCECLDDGLMKTRQVGT